MVCESFSVIGTRYRARTIRRLERDIFLWIGARPISDIKAPELLAVARRVESRGAVETAHRALGNCGQVFRYAIATGRAERDPTPDLRGALPPAKSGHFAAVTEPKQVAELLRLFDSYRGTLIVASALRIAPLVFVRPGELRRAEWAQIDLEVAEWRYTVTKTNTEPSCRYLRKPSPSCAKYTRSQVKDDLCSPVRSVLPDL